MVELHGGVVVYLNLFILSVELQVLIEELEILGEKLGKYPESSNKKHFI